ncbi:MAG TPA: transposase [Epulopiscium sp.]|nr:transposase [Candidatus Epulonipiscium sp.]
MDKKTNELVTFIKKIFKKVLALQNQVLSHNENWLHTRFSSINVTDSTTIQLPKEYLEKYMGCGGGGSKSSVKIQLEYNCYITNVPRELLEKGQIHDMYSLRWQIELMFKIWKSIFKIDKIKKVKINRFECFLYSRLISLLLTASIVFTIKRDLANAGHELSEMKSFSIVDKSFKRLRTDLFKSKKRLLALFYSFKSSIITYGLKSNKKNRKTPLEILEKTVEYASESSLFAS